MVSDTSAPYAPTFCTGVAPADPGMPDRHSSPPRPCSMALTTTSSKTAPASARTKLPSMVMPLLANRTTVRSVRFSAITKLEPPANTSGRSAPVLAAESRCRSAATTCSALVQVMTRRAIGPTRKVVSGANGTASAICAPAKSEPTPLRFMARKGSLTCYAAFIRHVGRLRGQRRGGSSGFLRGGLLESQTGRNAGRRRDP
ncbi:Uncharacterised protein [Mycobacterium tuberculosis]|nr:Uncharacterised protein [Mycobacterium tuberculosis]